MSTKSINMSAKNPPKAHHSDFTITWLRCQRLQFFALVPCFSICCCFDSWLTIVVVNCKFSKNRCNPHHNCDLKLFLYIFLKPGECFTTKFSNFACWNDTVQQVAYWGVPCVERVGPSWEQSSSPSMVFLSFYSKSVVGRGSRLAFFCARLFLFLNAEYEN